MVKIRNYKVNDYPKVKEILEEANLFDKVWDSEENLSGKIKNDPESILVATTDNDVVVGNVLIVSYGPKLKYLFRLAVKKEFRRQGVATELLKFATELVKGKGVQEVGLYADADNIKLISYYQKRGFKKSKSKYYYMWLDIK